MSPQSSKRLGIVRRLAVRATVIGAVLAASAALAAPAQAKTYEGHPTSCFSTHKVVTISTSTVGNYAHTHWPSSGSARTRTGLAMSPATIRVSFGWSTVRDWKVTAADFNTAYANCYEK
ncbi:hypothetical protein [Glycomyces albidus]|nr:hypothetical protein [Glycomyces albidus]